MTRARGVGGRRWSSHLAALAVACMAAGCAARSPLTLRPDPAPQFAARFRSLVHEGCYLCLRDVLDQSRTLAPRVRQSAVLQPMLARAALLFLLRTKELGIPVDEDWRLADRLVAARAPTSADYGLYYAMLRALPWTATGVGEDFTDANRQRFPGLRTIETWRQWLAARWPTDETAAYLYLSFNCAYRPQKPIDDGPVKAAYPDSPLIQYRWAVCADGGRPALAALLAGDPRFAEAGYFLARFDFNARQFNRAQQEDREAWEKIPRFTAAALASADLALGAEDFPEAARLYDAVLAIVPTHRLAMLGTIKSLSYQGQFQAAAELAQRMIALGHWYLGDAYYWLAWNDYQLSSIDKAFAAVQEAKQFDSGASVDTLAGLIRMRRTEWPDAKREFLAALKVDPGRCDAMFYLGRTEGMLVAWRDAAARFTAASACYAANERNLEGEIARLSAQPDATSQRKLARRRGELRDTIGRKAASFYNAAVSYAATGEREQALDYATKAEPFARYTDRAKALESRLRKQ